MELYEIEKEGTKLASDEVPSKSAAAAARIVLNWSISDIIPSTHFSNEDEEKGGAYANCQPDDFRNINGVLIATVHQVGGFLEGSQKY